MTYSRFNDQNARAQLAKEFNQVYNQVTSTELRDVGNYRIVKQIGEGSFGKVYLAFHKMLHTKVVLKCGDKNDPNVPREIYYHRQLKHPNIVKLYEIIVTESHVWMVLEFCGGDELYYHIYTMKRVPFLECQKLFFQIVRAVSYVHSLELSHRDLKLENILLDKKKTTVKLTDFGFVRESTPNNFLKTICGTTVYMAPELLKNEKYSGIAIDSWALGVILYTMLYGEMPFDEDDDDLKTKHKILTEDPVYKEDVPADAIQLLKQLLTKDPKKRLTTTGILASSFLSHINSEYQNEIEKKHRQTPFSSRSEKHLIKRFKALNIDIGKLHQSVSSNKCDQLSAFYELSLEKERRRRMKKKKMSRSRRVSALIESQPLERIKSSLSYRARDVGLLSRSNSNLRSSIVGTSPKSPKSTKPDLIILPPIERDVSFSTGNEITKNQTNGTVSSTNTPEKKKKNIFHKFSVKFWMDKLNMNNLANIGSNLSTSADNSTGSGNSIYTRKSNDSNSRSSNSRKSPSSSKRKDDSHIPHVDSKKSESQMSKNSSFQDSDDSTTSPLGSQRPSRRRPISIISQISAVSHLSQLSAMSESDYSYSPSQLQPNEVQNSSTRPAYNRTASSEVSMTSGSTSVTANPIRPSTSIASSNSSNNSEHSSIRSPGRIPSPDFLKKNSHTRNSYNEILPSSSSHPRMGHGKPISLRKAKSPISRRSFRNHSSWSSLGSGGRSANNRKGKLILVEEESDLDEFNDLNLNALEDENTDSVRGRRKS